MTEVTFAKDLAPLRLRAEREIDRRAGLKRQTYLTQAPGQDLEYTRTLDEARAYQDDPDPVDTDYPMLVAEQDAQIEALDNGATLQSVATEVIAQSDTWVAVGEKIKKARRKGKLLVGQAMTPAAIIAARDAALADLDAL